MQHKIEQDIKGRRHQARMENYVWECST